MKINKESIKQKIKYFFTKLNNSYEPVNEKPVVKIAELTIVLPMMGLFYLWTYFDVFDMNYFFFFDIKDSISVLYGKLMPIILIGIMLSPCLGFLIPDLFTKEKKGITMFSVIYILFVLIGGLWVIFNVYKFSLVITIIFLVLITFYCIIYFFFRLDKFKNLKFWIFVVIGFMYAFASGRNDAEQSAKTMAKYSIIIKNHSEEPLLTENNKCMYFIYKTSDHYFLRDKCKNLINVYSISNDEIISFTPKQ